MTNQELNREITLRVMGYLERYTVGFDPSNDMNDAWLVKEEMKRRGFSFTLWSGHCCEFLKQNDYAEVIARGYGSTDDSDAEAICLAARDAMKAMRGE